MPPSAKLIDLRALLAQRFPEKVRRSGGVVPTGARRVDLTLHGGLPLSRTTELVCTSPGCGGQSLFARLLASTRATRQRLALVDGADAFAPDELPSDLLRHLVWVRTSGAEQALAAADLIAHDGNYTVLALDVRNLPERDLRRLPAPLWYRLQRTVEDSSLALLVLTPFPLVPSVAWRLSLDSPLSLGDHRTPSDALADVLEPALVRASTAALSAAG